MGSSLSIEMSGDEAKLWRSLQKVINQQEKSEKGFKKIGEEATKAETKVDKLAQKMQKVKPPPAPPPIQIPKPPPVPPPVQIKQHEQALRGVAAAGESAFGAGMLAKLSSFASAAGLAAAGVATLKGALAKRQQDTATTLNEMGSLVTSRRDLAQIANSPSDLKNMVNRANTLAHKYGVDRATASDVVGDARTFGFEANLDPMFGAHYLASVKSQADVASKFPTFFKGSGVTSLQAVNMMGAAARESALKFEPLAEAMPAAAATTSQMGSTPEETLAVLSVLAANFKSGGVAADRIGAIGSRINVAADMGEKRLKGKTLLQALDVVNNDFSKKDRDEFLGKDKEVREGFSALMKNRAEVERVMGVVSAERAASGTSGSYLAKGAGIAMTDPVLRSARDRTAADVGRELAYQRNFGAKGTAIEVAKNQAKAKRAGEDPLSQYIAEQGTVLADATGNAAHVEGGAKLATFAAESVAVSPLWAAIKALKNASSNLEASSDQLKKSTAPPRTNAQRAEVNRNREN